MIRIFIQTSSSLLSEKENEEYVIFFENDITLEELQSEAHFCIVDYIFAHFSDYCKKFNLKADKDLDTKYVSEFEESVTTYWALITEDMLTNIINSSPDLKPEVIDELIEFSSDDGNLYQLDRFNFIENPEEEDYEEENNWLL